MIAIAGEPFGPSIDTCGYAQRGLGGSGATSAWWPKTAPTKNLAGTVIGDCVNDTVLGYGGFAITYLAHHVRLTRIMSKIICFFALVMLVQVGWTNERVALVIGNASYPSAPLKNPARDAQAMERTLSRLGFAVTRVENADRARMMRAVQDFRVRLQQGSVGFFYYSGHGVEIDGRNFLLPVGAAIRSQEDVLVEALDAAYVVAQMEAAGSALNLVVLDACRDNPLPAATRTAGKGLARMDGGTGTLIAFATAAGQVADDGAGTNSPYTAVLVEQLARPGLSVAEVFNETNLEVARLTGNRQRPWYSTSGVPTIRLAGVGVVGVQPRYV